MDVIAPADKKFGFIRPAVSADIRIAVAGNLLESSPRCNFKAGIARRIPIKANVLPTILYPNVATITNLHVSTVKTLPTINIILARHICMAGIHVEGAKLSASGEIDESWRIDIEGCCGIARCTHITSCNRHDTGDGAGHGCVERLVIDGVRVPSRRGESGRATEHHGRVTPKGKRSVFTKPVTENTKDLAIIDRHFARHLSIRHNEPRRRGNGLCAPQLRRRVKSCIVNDQHGSFIRRADCAVGRNRSRVFDDKNTLGDCQFDSSLKTGQIPIHPIFKIAISIGIHLDIHLHGTFTNQGERPRARKRRRRQIKCRPCENLDHRLVVHNIERTGECIHRRSGRDDHDTTRNGGRLKRGQRGTVGEDDRLGHTYRRNHRIGSNAVCRRSATLIAIRSSCRNERLIGTKLDSATAIYRHLSDVKASSPIIPFRKRDNCRRLDHNVHVRQRMAIDDPRHDGIAFYGEHHIIPRADIAAVGVIVSIIRHDHKRSR